MGGVCCLLSVIFVQEAFAADASVENAPDDQARTVVEVFHAALIDALRTPEYATREAQLRPRIAAAFDTQRISAISLGRTWRSLSDVQKETFAGLLSTLIVATYADRFDNYSGQRFVTDAVEPVKSGFVVRTRLERDNEKDVSLDYFLRQGKIFNVVADGVSDLSLRRADYNSIIKNEGYAQLLAHIEQKIAEARSDP